MLFILLTVSSPQGIAAVTPPPQAGLPGRQIVLRLIDLGAQSGIGARSRASAQPALQSASEASIAINRLTA
jgi:hypothetical protein